MLLDGTAAGYAALTFGFSLEVGGRDAFIDELFLIEAARGKGRYTRDGFSQSRSPKIGTRGATLSAEPKQ